MTGERTGDGRRIVSYAMVEQWAMKRADDAGRLSKQILEDRATIAERDREIERLTGELAKVEDRRRRWQSETDFMREQSIAHARERNLFASQVTAANARIKALESQCGGRVTEAMVERANTAYAQQAGYADPIGFAPVVKERWTRSMRAALEASLTPRSAAQPTDLADHVEAAAIRIMQSQFPPGEAPKWSDEDEDVREHYRVMARADLAADPAPTRAEQKGEPHP